MRKTELGKIDSIRVGMGGYQEAMMGVWINFKGKNMGVSDGKGFWTGSARGAKWAEKDRQEAFADCMYWMLKLITDAKVSSVEDLVGTPVEITFEGQSLKSWRILTEVL